MIKSILTGVPELDTNLIKSILTGVPELDTNLDNLSSSMLIRTSDIRQRMLPGDYRAYPAQKKNLILENSVP